MNEALLILAFFVVISGEMGCRVQHRGQNAELAGPRQVTFGTFAELGPVVSPDGRWVAFEYFPDSTGDMHIWIMPTDGPFSSARPIVNDGQYHAGISWSPDSQWIAYMTGKTITPGSTLITSQIDKTNIHTRQTVRLTHFREGAAIGDNTSWSKDGRIAFELDDTIYVVPDSGGEPRAVVKLADKGKGLSFTPTAPTAWSPDGRKIAFQTDDDSDNYKTLWIAVPASGELTAVAEHQKICCVSWPFADKLLLSRVANDGSARVCLFSLRDHKFEYLTNGPMDLSPALHPTKAVLLFNHSPTRHFQETFSLVPKLHVWEKYVPQLAKGGRPRG